MSPDFPLPVAVFTKLIEAFPTETKLFVYAEGIQLAKESLIDRLIRDLDVPAVQAGELATYLLKAADPQPTGMITQNPF